MVSIYIVLEMTNSATVIYPTTYKTYAEALEAIRVKWWQFLHYDDDYSPHALWHDAVTQTSVENNVTHLYLEKENFFQIHKLPLPE
jgi:hypothetical protein